MADFLCHLFKDNLKLPSNYYVLSGREMSLNQKDMVLVLIELTAEKQ